MKIDDESGVDADVVGAVWPVGVRTRVTGTLDWSEGIDVDPSAPWSSDKQARRVKCEKMVKFSNHAVLQKKNEKFTFLFENNDDRSR